MILYAQYIKECWNREYKEWPWGFTCYELCTKTSNLHIWDAFIAKEERNKGHYEELIAYLEGIAKEAGLKYLTGDVYRILPNMEQSVMAQIKNGGKFVYTGPDKVTLAKEL